MADGRHLEILTSTQQQLRQPFGQNRYGPKIGGCAFLGEGERGPHLTQSRLGWGLPSHQVASRSIQPFGHSRHGPKMGAVPPFWRGSWVPTEPTPRLAQCGLGVGLPPCQVPSWSIQLFGQNKHGPKIERAPPPFWGGRTGSPSNTMSLGAKPTSLPSGILIHPAIWPQHIWVKNWGLCPLGGGGAGSPSNTMWPGPRPTCLPAKFQLDPSNRLTTIHQRHRQTGQDRQTDRQQSDSTGRTVLQMVAQKC